MTVVNAWPAVLGIVAAFLALMLVVGVRRRRTLGSGAAGFVTADRNLGAIDVAALLFGTMFSAFTFLGAPGLAYSRGGAILYVVAYGVLGALPLYVVGPRIASIGRRLDCVTQAQFISARFPSRLLRLLIAAIGAGVALPYLALQMQGAGLIMEWLTGGEVSRTLGAGVTFAVVALYVSFGGVGAVARTSVWQASLKFLVACGLGVYFPVVLHGGLQPMVEQIALTRPELLSAPGLGPDGTPWPWVDYASLIVTSAIAFAMWPHLFLRVFAARDAKSLRTAVAFLPLYQLILLPVSLVGLSGVGIVSVSRPDAVLLELVARSNLPGVVVGLVCAAAIASAMSTGDAILHCAASTTVEDIVAPLVPMQSSTRLLLMQLAVPVFAALAFTLAVTNVLPIVMMVIFAYGFVIQLAPGVYAALAWRRATTAGVGVGLLGGLGVAAALSLRPALNFSGLDPGLTGLVVNCLLLGAVSMSTAPQAAAQTDPFTRDLPPR